MGNFYMGAYHKINSLINDLKKSSGLSHFIMRMCENKLATDNSKE
jgi:hypothetical protein